jgi:pimeloyl-ACP methyl ester carboxylesterase
MTFTSRRTRLVGVALTAIAVHLVVLALFTQGWSATLGALAWLAVAPLLLRGFDRGGRVARAAVAGVPGLGALAGGTIAHVGHAALNGPTLLDVTGILVAVAGAVLLGVAFASLFSRTRRAVKLLSIPLVLVLAQFYVGPVLVMGTLATNAKRDPGKPAASLGITGAEDVRFTAQDGVPLSGWYIPGSSARAVVVLHGSHGTRASTTPYIRFLHAAGYGVLAYDARGHGASDGNENALGWLGDRDLAGAVAYTRSRGARSIGALGLSMGGEEALRAAAVGVGLTAVVADGAGAGTLGDAKLEEGTSSALFTAVTWIGMRTVALFSGDAEPQALEGILHRIDMPVLLIASNRANERRIDGEFARRIGPRARLWYLADTGHTQGLRRHPAEYESRVLAFFDQAVR